MDKDRIAGSVKQVAGAIKQTIGRLLGDQKAESEGAAKVSEGKVQNAVGGLKDTVRAAIAKKE